MRALPAATVLDLWERGRSRHPIDRALLLLALATPEADPEGLADVSLGRRNATLLELRQAIFGDRLRGYLDCPRCGERFEFDLSASDLLASAHDLPDRDTLLDVDGLRFRLPTSRDLAHVAKDSDTDAAASSLLERCLVDEGPVAVPVQTSLASCMDRVEAALEQADPYADVVLDFQCEVCGHDWTTPFDIAAFLWEEVEARARNLLSEVHVLARAYGWREADILNLSEARRAAYLERVTV